MVVRAILSMLIKVVGIVEAVKFLITGNFIKNIINETTDRAEALANVLENVDASLEENENVHMHM